MTSLLQRLICRAKMALVALSTKAELNLFHVCDWIAGGKYSRHWQKDLEIVYVNLESRSDRRRHMEQMLAKLGVSANRFCAIKAERDSLFEKFDFLKGREISEFVRMGIDAEPPKMGAISNYLSKREIIARSAAMERRFTLVLEDDVSVGSKALFPFAVWKANGMNSEWDVLLFDPAGPWRPEDKIGWNLFYPRATFPIYWGSHALLLNNKRASHVISVLDSTLVHNIDGILFPNRTAIKTFVVRAGLCSQDDYGSDIRL